MSDQDHLHEDYSELDEGYFQDGGIEALPAAVTTDIEGGKTCGIPAVGPVELAATEDELIQGLAVMKTAVVEQSHKI